MCLVTIIAYAHTHTQIHLRIHTRIHVRARAPTNTHMHTHSRSRAHTRIHERTHARTRARTHTRARTRDEKRRKTNAWYWEALLLIIFVDANRYSCKSRSVLGGHGRDDWTDPYLSIPQTPLPVSFPHPHHIHMQTRIYTHVILLIALLWVQRYI